MKKTSSPCFRLSAGGWISSQFVKRSASSRRRSQKTTCCLGSNGCFAKRAKPRILASRARFATALLRRHRQIANHAVVIRRPDGAFAPGYALREGELYVGAF